MITVDRFANQSRSIDPVFAGGIGLLVLERVASTGDAGGLYSAGAEVVVSFIRDSVRR